MSRWVNTFGWKVIVAALALAIVIGIRAYKETPQFRLLKTATKTVPADMVMSEQLPANEQAMKLRLVATESEGRPLRIYWLDDRQELSQVDPARIKLGLLCDNSNLAQGAVFELTPGRYYLCFELSEKGLQQNAKPFNLTYSLYEYR